MNLGGGELFGLARYAVSIGVAVFLAGCMGTDTEPFGAEAAENAASAPAALEKSELPALDWQPCGEEFPGVECAAAPVPLDYDRPHGARTRIALARVTAGDPENRIGTLFVNPGGPGSSGVELVLAGFAADLGSLLDGRFDVVGFDPRGVANSEPLHCFATEGELIEFVTEQPVFPYTARQQRPFFAHFRSTADHCLHRRARIAPHMSTADVARDLDRLRRYVGDDKLTYLGFSYGSQIGNSYANLFPKNVRALAIDGVLDPRHWVEGSTIVDDRLASAEVFAEFARLCDEAGEACAFSSTAGAAARFEMLAERISTDPLIFEDFVYAYDLFISDVLVSLYAPEVWAGDDGLAALLAFVEAALVGDLAASENAARVRQSLLNRLHLSPERVQERYPNGWDAYYGVRCADAEFPRSFSAWSKIGKFVDSGSRFGAAWWWQDVGCAGWPLASDRYAGPWTSRTSAPVLVIGNHFDPATPYAGAVASDELLGNSRLLSYAGWGHCAFGRSACVADYVRSYFLDGVLPAKGTVCPANPSPFLVEQAPSAARTLAAPQLSPIGLPPARPGPH